MKKFAIIAGGIVIAALLIVIIGLKLFFKPIVEAGFHAAGFEKATVGEAQFGFSTSTLKNITLDAAGNTIGEVTIAGSPRELAGRRAREIYVSDVKLAWPLETSGDGAGPINLFAQKLAFKNVTVTVPTAMGPLPVKLEGDITEVATAYRVNVSYIGAETFGKAAGKAVGVIDKGSRAVKAQVVLAEGELRTPDAELLKISGSFKAETDPAAPLPVITGELAVGAMKIFGVPMEGTALKIAPAGDVTQIRLAGQVINNSGSLKLDVDIDHKDPALDKMTLRLESELKDLSALDVVDMGGAGNLIVTATGEHVKGKSWDDLSQWQNLIGTGGLELRTLSLPGLMRDAEALAAFRMSLDPVTKQLKLKASEGEVIFKGAISAAGNRPLYASIPINNIRPPTLIWDGKSSVMTVDFVGGSVNALGFSARKMDANLNISLDDNPSVNGTLDIGELRQMVQPAQMYFIPVGLALQLDSGKNGTGFQGKVTEKNGRLSATISGTHNGKAGKGNVSVKMPPTNFTSTVPVATVFPFTQYYFMDATGSTGLTANFTWEKQKNRWVTANNGQIYLKDVTATVRDNVISGINTVMNLASIVPPVIQQQVVAVGAVNVGLPLTDGVATVSLEQIKAQGNEPAGTAILIHNAEWSAVGGRIVSTPVRMRFDTMTTDFTLQAQQLDLQQMFNIAPLEGLTATGKVNGQLPIHAEKGRFSVKNGVLNTIAPGVIKYDPENMPEFLQNPTQKQILDLKAALTQFNYESLGLTIDGELGKSQQIGMKIKGRNPLFYAGKPVNFNLNVEGPIENIIKYNPGSSRIPDGIRKLMEAYEASNAKK